MGRKLFGHPAEARSMYVMDGHSIPVIAKHFKVAVQTIYALSYRENWNLLRESKSDELFKLRMGALNDLKAESMEFYRGCLEKCIQLLAEVDKPLNLKFLVESRILAENRILLLAGEELEKKEEIKSKGDGLLDELAGL